MEEVKFFVVNNIGTIIGYVFGGGSIYAYLFEKRKNKALTNQEVAKASQEEATALSSMRQAYKEFTEDMNLRYNLLSDEIKTLTKKLTDVSSELNKEKEKYNTLKIDYDILKKEFDNYKKTHDK